ncbi:MAG: flagellar basal-body MS-ring/collar protein FliF [Pseudomonadota bacterium]
MQQFMAGFMALSPMRRIVVLGATVGVFSAVLGLARMASAPQMALLYAGLEPAAAGEVVAALEQAGTPYEVRGTSIFVDAAQRDATRLELAAQGQPAMGAQGYELLEAMSGFGTTAQMFDATYWRAKEGELARTIVASPAYQSARVHISNQAQNRFSMGGAPKASVTVAPAAGRISSAQARALKHLVASAVANLDPERVSVIDARTGLVDGGAGDAMGNGLAMDERAAALKQNVERLLAARVGPGNAVVEIMIDPVTEREQIRETLFDPDSRVAISTDTQEITTSAQDQGSNAVTVASNLPDGEASGAGNSSTSQNSETRERVNFEVAETQREILRTPGAIRRMSVAVLVDGVRGSNADGDATWEPRPAAELASLRALVESAVGFDAERGDTVTLESLEFLPVAEAGSTAPAAPLFSAGPINVMQLALAGLTALVTLAIAALVVRPAIAAIAQGRPAPSAPMGLPAPEDGKAAAPALAPAGADDIDSGLPALEGDLPPLAIAPAPMGLADLGGGELVGIGGGDGAADRLRALVGERREESAAVLQSWVEDRGAA